MIRCLKNENTIAEHKIEKEQIRALGKKTFLKSKKFNEYNKKV